jgi:hypothetical protein
MKPIRITCQSCGRGWSSALAFSLYAQQAIESCPCPGCGAYTLNCTDTNAVAVTRKHLCRLLAAEASTAGVPSRLALPHRHSIRAAHGASLRAE